MGFLFSKPSYQPARDIPDLTGKVVIVTGANAGIGYHTVDQLARRGAKVYLACRTESKAREAISAIERATPSLKGQERLIWLPLDLSSLHSAQKAADEFLAKEKRLDILVNNAGRMTESYVLTKDGIEQSVSVNHVGHFVFTTALLPLLKETAKQPGADVRIIIVSSELYHLVGRQTVFGSLEDFNDRQALPGKENDTLAKLRRYGTTKLMNILFTRELQRRLDEDGAPISVIALHPGIVATEGAHTVSTWWMRIGQSMVSLTPLEGAFTTLFAATSAQVAAERGKFKGQYLMPYGKLQPLKGKARDAKLAQTLWATTEKVVEDVLGRPAA
ncbi:NAD-P-binding protein [Artomyces pyxidatus]|uniref:NAD-P-binding protein n=1 Tax=Artomyces pyxidatus TaxID=48021 RepID=A0ACB8TDQ0_9AGAM|nr:NAD-P-binding protein [Artomyces pyxidatus]